VIIIKYIISLIKIFFILIKVNFIEHFFAIKKIKIN